ncbi:MAG TPA: glycosyltransferase, partial [Anaerolineae bacterium]|nr:glycosyltransferase [Anaerolineae bacterium]
PRPLDQAKEKLGIPPHHQMILFAGRIEPLKGIDTLLQAIALLHQENKNLFNDVCVCIIGGDPQETDPTTEMSRLQQLRQQLGLTDLVTFLGAKDQNTLPWYYSAATMVIMPSHYESFGLVALEAMSSGTPVIASAVGGLSFLIQDKQTGYLIPSRNPTALAQKIKRLLDDPTTRQQLATGARNYTAQYDWPLIIKQLRQIYQQAIDHTISDGS